jgi:hypothetical protein
LFILFWADIASPYPGIFLEDSMGDIFETMFLRHLLSINYDACLGQLAAYVRSVPEK